MNRQSLTGIVRKMKARLHEHVQYQMPVGESLFPVSDRVGSHLAIRFTGNIQCIACGRSIAKTFNQGYCYPCFRSLAECDMCILKPETCHYQHGTCRDYEWADNHCMQDHIVYLSNTSGIKVGITRSSQIPTRWIDQGARQAVAIFRVKSRFHSGLIEVVVGKHLSDRTDWRKMLKGNPEEVDMREYKASIYQLVKHELDDLRSLHPDFMFELLEENPVTINYPVETYPDKIAALNLHRQNKISGRLMGIKGQYLIMDCGVVNLRKFAGYEVEVC